MFPEPHKDALESFRRAYMSESKLRYALRDSDKKRPFEAIGFSEEAENWRELRDEIAVSLRRYPAVFREGTRWGELYYVDLSVSGPRGIAPVRTGWIYRIGEDFPRLTTLYVRTTEWKRQERR